MITALGANIETQNSHKMLNDYLENLSELIKKQASEGKFKVMVSVGNDFFRSKVTNCLAKLGYLVMTVGENITIDWERPK